MRHLLPSLALTALVLSPLALHAQGSLIQVGPSRLPNPTADATANLGAPWPDAIYIAPVPNAPFTATIVGDRTSMQSVTPNSQTGQVMFAGNHRLVARDAAGHLMIEQRAFIHDGQKDGSELLATDFIDPASMKFLRCIPRDKTCYLYNLRTAKGGYLTYTAADRAMLGLSADQFSHLPGVNIKSLGQKTLEGIAATGYRAHLERALNDQSDLTKSPTTKNYFETYTGEIWYSPELQADLKMSYSNIAGDHTDTLKDIKRGPPDRALFLVPGGYKIAPGN